MQLLKLLRKKCHQFRWREKDDWTAIFFSYCKWTPKQAFSMSVAEPEITIIALKHKATMSHTHTRKSKFL